MKLANIKNTFEMVNIALKKKYIVMKVCGWGERSVNRRSFAYGFTRGIR